MGWSHGGHDEDVAGGRDGAVPGDDDHPVSSISVQMSIWRELYAGGDERQVIFSPLLI